MRRARGGTNYACQYMSGTCARVHIHACVVTAVPPTTHHNYTSKTKKYTPLIAVMVAKMSRKTFCCGGTHIFRFFFKNPTGRMQNNSNISQLCILSGEIREGTLFEGNSYEATTVNTGPFRYDILMSSGGLLVRNIIMPGKYGAGQMFYGFSIAVNRIA